MLRRQRNTRETLFITSFPPLQKASWNGLSSPKPPSIHAGAGSPPYSGSHKCVVTSTAGKPSSFFRIIACPLRGLSFVCAACHLSVLLVKEQIVKYGAGPKCEGGSRVRYGVSG